VSNKVNTNWPSAHISVYKNVHFYSRFPELGEPIPECQTTMDFAAVDDRGRNGDNWNSFYVTRSIFGTLAEDIASC